MDASADRDLDLVLLGATGFVGRLTAQHLADHAPASLRLALAGRSPERLDRLRGELGSAAKAWELVTVDVTDDRALRALVARARVVASTVGPYLRYGLSLVQACADLGTDYADLTGESLFARRSIDTAHLRAKQTGARIVHSCGIDSVPSDLGVGLLAARVEAEGQGQLGRTGLYVRSMRGGISGGTIDSLRQQVIEMRDHPELRAVVSNPACLADGEDP
ncbi:MAG TPA: saccharopine dehydrogenase NADP-binding domain-containing protein, partial [Propionibacteriaceae bacterium]